MLDPRMVEDVIDDVLGNKKDPLRLAKDHMNQVCESRKRVERLELSLADMVEEKNRYGSLTAGTKIIEKIEEKEHLLEVAKIDAEATEKAVGKMIRRLNDKQQRDLLTYRYIANITDWRQIAEQLDISQAAAKRLHHKALANIKKIMDKKEKRRNDTGFAGIGGIAGKDESGEYSEYSEDDGNSEIGSTDGLL